MKNAVAKTAVVRVRKLPDPEEPNRLADAPAPNDAPISAPLPCCIRTNTTMVMATIK